MDGKIDKLKASKEARSLDIENIVKEVNFEYTRI
jgi:hypothetical protein